MAQEKRKVAWGWEGSRTATDGDGGDIMSSESEDSGMEDDLYAGEIENDQNTGKVECGKEINALEIDSDQKAH